MASISSTARFISQVSRELLRVELHGCVQTVFPIHACMQPTANSETQDYGNIDNDGPSEGAMQVFQVILRDLGTGHGRHHLINAYFYDTWASNFCRLSRGDEIAVSGPVAKLVRPDPSAGSGDHPFCLVFHTASDDDLICKLGAVAGEFDEGGSSSGMSEAGVVCRIVKVAGQAARGGSVAGDRKRRAGRGAGAGGGGGTGRQGGKSYVYTNLASLRAGREPGTRGRERDTMVNVYGVVCSFSHRHQSKGSDMTTSLVLLDESCTTSDSAVPCNFFRKKKDELPAPVMVGDIVRVHRAKVGMYMSRPQLVCSVGASFLVIRRRQAFRETFQRGIPGGVDAGDESLMDPDNDSPPSGPDAGGGEAGLVLPVAEWEVEASSPHYSMSQVDLDRCNALRAWFVGRAPYLRLAPSSEPKIWVEDTFRPPRSGQTMQKTEVDLVCCLLSKQEKDGGGAGSLSHVYVADGTGCTPTPSPLGRRDIERREACRLKGMRAALGKPDWSFGDPRPRSIPAHLRVSVEANKEEWEALALSPGMWIRLRRLTITKDLRANDMTAAMIEKASSVNPLHPGMAEVQELATACAKASSSRSSSGNTATPPRSDNLDSRQPPRNGVAPRAPGVQRGTEAGGRGSNDRASGGPGTAGLDGGRPSPPRATGWQRPPGSLSANELPRQGTIPQMGLPSGRSGTGEQRVPVSPSTGTNGNLANGDRVGAGGTSGRGVKRGLPTPEAALAAQGSASAAEESAAPDGAPLSNLGVVRRTPAPKSFNTRVRIVAHFPPKVEEFVRQGPGPGGRLSFLFTLRLEDDYGVLNAVASGLHASRLLPGRPSPATFLNDRGIRKRVERELARLESDAGGVLSLRLRSYLRPMAIDGRRGGSSGGPPFCKRFSIVAPSSLDGGGDTQG